MREEIKLENIWKEARDKLIVALDYSNMKEGGKSGRTARETISTYKVGLESYLATEGSLVDYLHEKAKKYFWI